VIKIFIKVRTVNNDVLLALCDEDLIGKKLTDDFTVDSKFYGTRRVNESEAVKEMQKATILNLTGEESVRTGIKAGLILESSIVKIKGIPHAQMIVYK